MKYLLFIVVFFTAKPANAQRIVLPFNNDWQFSKDNFSFQYRNVSWQNITLPHTWNVNDVMDDEPGYYRGPAWYRKIFRLDKNTTAKELYLLIEGANQRTTVYINGKKINEHIGGYTAFITHLTPYLYGRKAHELVINVDNSHDKNIPPLTADFTFYGGLYRDVKLIAVAPLHFSFGEKGDKGIFISTPLVNAGEAVVDIKSNILNETKRIKKLLIKHEIVDAAGNVIVSSTENITSNPFQKGTIDQKLKLSNPKLWSPDDPYLYKVISNITDAVTGKKLDEQVNPLGLRWFSFDGEKGFFLNGKYLKLMGASRHQDYKGLGNVVPDSLARKDVQLLKSMGANFLRVAHYPQDPAVLQACDELGILASVEIPVVNEITETDSFYNNCISMQQEMIRQHYNHPSVIVWCYMNEILLRPSFSKDKERQKKYFSDIAMLAKKLDSTTKKEDPYRPTMIAHHGNYNLYKEVGLIDIPEIVGWNLYQGWYGASINDLPVYLDRFHKEYPAKPMMITEYGADADPRIRSTTPLRFDKSIEYATYYHQFYLEQIMLRPFVAGAQVWNLADFNSETRNETMPHINNKGLLQWDRTPKDPYYFYRSVLSDQPFVKILGADIIYGTADSTGVIAQKIIIATNAGRMEIIINGKKIKHLRRINSLVTEDAVLKNGVNAIEVTAFYKDTSITIKKDIECRLQPYTFEQGHNIEPLNILMGAKRFFKDEKGNVWMPNQEYRKGSWGSVGGQAFKLPKGQLPYGTDKNIKGTKDDPIYQTQLVGITAYNLDVPDGQYEITFHFAELLGGKVEGLVYSLNDGDRTETTSERIFTVLVNDKIILEHFNIAKEAGGATAFSKKIKLNAENGNGIRVIFKAEEGETVLNALQVKKIIKKG